MANLKLLQELKDKGFPQDTQLSIVYQEDIEDEDFETYLTKDLVNENYKDDEFSTKLALPSFQEIWEQLPKIITEENRKYGLALTGNSICYDFMDYPDDFKYQAPVYDNNVTEAIAKLWLLLKSLNLLDDIHDSGVITNLQDEVH